MTVVMLLMSQMFFVGSPSTRIMSASFPGAITPRSLTPALVMGVDKDRGVLAPGELADMILVDGDPTKNIWDINNITTVIKGGKVYDPVAIEKALGITPRESKPK